MKRWALLATLLVVTACPVWGVQKYDVRGLVLKVDGPHKTMLVSCESIPGYMEAMAMPFTVREPKMLEGLQPGTCGGVYAGGRWGLFLRRQRTGAGV